MNALLFFSLAAVLGAQDLPPIAAGPAYPRERIADLSHWEPLHCRGDVREAFERIWLDCRQGRSSDECALRIDQNPDGGIEIVYMGEDDMRDTATVRRRSVQIVPHRTIAIAHTHPADTRAGVGPADDEVPVAVNYIIAGRNRGLYRWDRDLGETRRALRRGMDWLQPCSEEEIAQERAAQRMIAERAAEQGQGGWIAAR